MDALWGWETGKSYAKKFFRVVAVASSRQLLGHVGLADPRFRVSPVPRFAAGPGLGGAADRPLVSFKPLADYCP